MRRDRVTDAMGRCRRPRQVAILGLLSTKEQVGHQNQSVIVFVHRDHKSSCVLCPRSHLRHATPQRMQVGLQEAPRNVPLSELGGSERFWIQLCVRLYPGITSWNCRLHRVGCTCLSISYQIVSLDLSLAGRQLRYRSSSERTTTRMRLDHQSEAGHLLKPKTLMAYRPTLRLII